MKTLIALLLTLTLIVPAFADDDVSLSVCMYPDGVYQFAYTGHVDSYTFSGAETYDMDALTASGYGVAFTVQYSGTSQTIYGYPDVPRCPEVDEWQPGAPSIYVPMDSACAFVDIRDVYGNWSRVESNGEPVLLHYGQALIGSNGQSTDPADYRAVATPCF